MGDWVEVQDQTASILQKNLTLPYQHRWMNHVLHSRRKKSIQMRSKIESGIRDFFLQKEFIETRTPLLVPSPGTEPHIPPFKVENTSSPTFLPTSPEFAMKKLLSGGLEKIFQIAPAFRNEPRSKTHLQEFTLLEWYRAHAPFESIMNDTEELLESLALQIHSSSCIHYQDLEILLQRPWPRFSVQELFQEHCQIDLEKNLQSSQLAEHGPRLGLSLSASEHWDDLYFKVWLNCIEPRLPQNQAVIVHHYPASQAALAVLDPDNPLWARRFEVYVGGIELANAFEELTDAHEQRERFEKDQQFRREVYGQQIPESPIDEDFMHALEEGMPPSSGIALGVDRLVMLFADESDIQFTQWFPV